MWPELEVYKVFLEIYPLDTNDNINCIKKFKSEDIYKSSFSELLKRNDSISLEYLTSESVSQNLEETLDNFFEKFEDISAFIDHTKYKRTLHLQTLFNDEMHFYTIPSRLLEAIQRNKLYLRTSCDFLELECE